MFILNTGNQKQYNIKGRLILIPVGTSEQDEDSALVDLVRRRPDLSQVEAPALEKKAAPKPEKKKSSKKKKAEPKPEPEEKEVEEVTPEPAEEPTDSETTPEGDQS